MYWLIKNWKLISRSSEFMEMEWAETIKISNDFINSERRIENYKPIVKTLKDFQDEIEAQNKIIVEDAQAIDPDLITELVPEYIAAEKYQEYLDSFIENDFDLVETLESKNLEIEAKVSEIKRKCSEDILRKYSITDQANMTANVARINALCTREKRDPSAEENELLNEADVMFLEIKELRDKCAEEIETLFWN